MGEARRRKELGLGFNKDKSYKKEWSSKFKKYFKAGKTMEEVRKDEKLKNFDKELSKKKQKLDAKKTPKIRKKI